MIVFFSKRKFLKKKVQINHSFQSRNQEQSNIIIKKTKPEREPYKRERLWMRLNQGTHRKREELRTVEDKKREEEEEDTQSQEID